MSIARRLTLLETESFTAESRLGKMTIDLANTCKQVTLITPHFPQMKKNKLFLFQADEIQRRVRQLESKCMNNEANIEDLEKLLYEARTMYQESMVLTVYFACKIKEIKSGLIHNFLEQEKVFQTKETNNRRSRKLQSTF